MMCFEMSKSIQQKQASEITLMFMSYIGLLIAGTFIYLAYSMLRENKILHSKDIQVLGIVAGSFGVMIVAMVIGVFISVGKDQKITM